MTNRRDDDFRIRPSAPKNRGQGFVSKVLQQAGKASGGKSTVRRPGGSGKGTGQRPGSRLGRGHTAARFAGAKLTPMSRRVTIKTLLVNQQRASPQSLAKSVGSIVLVPLPAEAAALAAQRGYLPTRIPLLKRVGAVAPQEVCIADGSVRINGVPSAAVLSADRWGRPLPSWQQCRRLRPGELFLLSVTNPASFDSRYFGPVSVAAVIGVAHPVWLDSRP